MPSYRYTARDEAGKELTGVVTADDLASAHRQLELMNLEPVYVQPDAGSLHNSSESPDSTLPSESVLKKQWDSLENFSLNEEKLHQIHDTSNPLPATNKHVQKEEEKNYYPFSETLRLYAGWLIAWYALVYALGYYQMTRNVTPAIPYVYGLLYSPLVLTLAGIAFMFLLTHSLTRTLRLEGLKKLVVWLLAIGAFVGFRMNV